MADSGSTSNNSACAKVILQQCTIASLQVQPQTEETEAKFVHIGHGLVVYICFLKGSDIEIVDKIVKAVLNAKLSRNNDGKLVSVLDLPGDVLIVPQATLGGKLKGKSMQYHTNIDKSVGLELYTEFVKQCSEMVENNNSKHGQDCCVKNGTYGNLQVLKMDTNGPFSHILEF